MRRWAPLLVALGAVACVLLPYAALGGGAYDPTPVADPCVQREWRDPGGIQEVVEQIILSALDGAACELGVSREDLVLAVRDEESLDEFAEEQGISRAHAEQALERGIDRAIADAEEAGALSGFVAELVARTLDSVPPWLLLDTLERILELLP